MSQNIGSVSPGTREWLRSNAYDLECILVTPGTEWMAKDVGLHSSYIIQLKRYGIIKRVGWDEKMHRAKYITTNFGYEVLSKAVDTRKSSDGFMPCNHSGFISHDKTIECKRCGEIYLKESLR